VELQDLYIKIQDDINARLSEFKNIWENGDDGAVFREMCFCMCTPQNNAQKAWNAVLRLESKGLLYSAEADKIAATLRDEGVRFHNNKAGHIAFNTINYYPRTKKKIAETIAGSDIIDARNFFAKNIRGWGLKEASHFLRNIGFGDVCILDRHIMRQLALYNVIDAVPKTLSKSKYLAIEQAMLTFSKKKKIPSDALDLLFWYKETGGLFK
jgi:N-glycosylase/DNA lyase